MVANASTTRTRPCWTCQTDWSSFRTIRYSAPYSWSSLDLRLVPVLFFPCMHAFSTLSPSTKRLCDRRKEKGRGKEGGGGKAARRQCTLLMCSYDPTH